MEITIEHNEGKYPSFNVCLHSKEGAEPFLVVKGCRIVEGPKGPFVSGPATKNQNTGKYWNHTYFGDKFSAVVLSKAQEAMAKGGGTGKRVGGQRTQARDDLDDVSDIPF